MRKLLASLLVLSFCALALPAYAQKTKAQMTTEINTNWPDNTVQQITPALLRSTVLDIVNSYHDANGGTSLPCAAHQWVAALPTLSSISCVQPAFSDISGTIAPTQIPPPGASTLGGVFTVSCSANQWITAITNTGASSCGGLPAGIDTGITTQQTSNYTAASTDCGNPIYLGGNAKFTVTVNAVGLYSANCHLIFINVDAYTGVGTGRGKLMAINGLTSFFIYPNQRLDIRPNQAGSAWQSDQPVDGQFGFVWFVPNNNVNFFIDTGGSDTANDGLASGASGAFQNISRCVQAAYQQVYMRRLQSTITCSNTAGQSQSPAGVVTAFYQLPNSSFTINSATPGTQWTWNCASGAACYQFGDNFLGGVTDVSFVASASSTVIVTGHQFSIIDLLNVKLTASNGSTVGLGCDTDSHFNISSTFQYTGTFQLLFSACQGSSWVFNNAVNVVGASATLGRFANVAAASKVTFSGNVTFVTAGLTSSAAAVTGNSVVNNLSGSTLPGGTPTPATGGQYCTSAC